LLEGRTPPRAGLRLARGPDAPSREILPRSRLAWVPHLRPVTSHLLPNPSIKCSGTSWVPGSKANPRHTGSLTPPGNPTPAQFRRPPVLCGHPRHCTTLCGEASVNSVRLCRLFPYDWRAAPSKGDGRTLEKGTSTHPTPAQDGVVTSDQWNASPRSPSALCVHPRRYAAIPSSAAPSPML
jgi:hypothetical protein